uniref:RRM domain-containing protein n=1 Tax=Chrysotila carterae TaxID=13221 RepID=A0A6S9RWN0_CHRCT|mmetsp:Transcript_2352/g.4930  ORF Transcript_2352/g.4930 Transcript_2352/m.4930 type:complete len:117 (+) Transcript_2352:132-482(+)
MQAAVNDKRTLYVGGLEESVTEEILRAAFIPFGEIIDVNMPLDTSSQKHRGFAFVQYDEKDDAADAIDNMNGSELFGRVLRVNTAKPDAASRGSHRPVWEAQADKFFEEKTGAEAE